VKTYSRLAVVLLAVAGHTSIGGTLIVSGNDGKAVRVDGSYMVDPKAVPDTLVVLEGKSFPPHIIGQTVVHHSVSAPPSSVALSPDEKIVLLAAPNQIDPNDPSRLRAESFLQVIAIDGVDIRVLKQIPLPHQPLAVAINKAGTLALTVQGEGELSLFSVSGQDVELLKTVAIGTEDAHTSSVAFTPDGRWVLVTFRAQDKVGLLSVDGQEVSPPRYKLATGHKPYVVEIAPNGKFAVVGNVSQTNEEREADNDSISIIDLTAPPFKVSAQQHVPLGPEGLAISPDSKWIAVSSINGSNAKPASPQYHDHGILSLFRVKDGKPAIAGTAWTGIDSQGVLFTRDGRYIILQDYMESVLSIYTVQQAGPVKTNIEIKMPGRPSSIAAAR
jgi:DNA-binding beta-propeller fold protein YncE